MPVYNFKSMKPVPNATELVDIVLTRTQRRTPTVIHPGYKISRIRSFYMRKIKFTQQTISERLGQMLEDFPRLNDIHPFYADLCNTLYDKDHYKLALGQINTARSLVDAIARDMIRMVKYGDSLYRCKCLKRAALGRMCTVLKRQKAALAYLEEVRKHMSRLPALDPHTRTILMCGLPNVGKSSFMNKITRANVDVQPYAFTTKSLFVGHTDYRYLRWQVIDTPGILDHSLEERNTIEMQAITALAHLTCSVLYFVDISEQCGFTLEQQCSLFRSIQPLFANKELIVVVNKIDQQPWDTLPADKQAMIEALTTDLPNTTLMKMSNHSEQGVSEVKNAACDRLLAARVESRISTNKLSNVMNRLQVFYPSSRDDTTRQPFIPDSVKTQTTKQQQSRVGYAPTKHDNATAVTDDDDDNTAMDEPNTTKTARELMWENGGPGVWAPDYREQYDLKNDEWKFDAIPELMDGKNIIDYVDPDIDAKLEALEREEEQLVAEQNAAEMDAEVDSDLEEEEQAAVQAIRERKNTMRKMNHVNKSQNRPILPRAIRNRRRDKHDEGKFHVDNIQKHMDQTHGVDTSAMIQNRAVVGTKRSRDDDDDSMDDNVDNDISKTQAKKQKKQKRQTKRKEVSDLRAHDALQKEGLTDKQSSLKDETAQRIAKRMDQLGKKPWAKVRSSGEGDQRQTEHLIRWMNTGKKRNGTHYCR